MEQVRAWKLQYSCQEVIRKLMLCTFLFLGELIHFEWFIYLCDHLGGKKSLIAGSMCSSH